MVCGRRINDVQAAAVEAAIRYADICDRDGAHRILKRSGVWLTVECQTVHPLGLRGRPEAI